MSDTITESKFRITLTVDGHDWGLWDKKTGGGFTTGASLYQAAGGQVALSGLPATAALVLTRAYNLDRDHAHMPLLYSQAAKNKKATVKQLPLDADGNAFGSAIVWTGILTDVKEPDTDSTSVSAAQLEVTILPIGNPVAS